MKKKENQNNYKKYIKIIKDLLKNNPCLKNDEFFQDVYDWIKRNKCINGAQLIYIKNLLGKNKKKEKKEPVHIFMNVSKHQKIYTNKKPNPFMRALGNYIMEKYIFDLRREIIIKHSSNNPVVLHLHDRSTGWNNDVMVTIEDTYTLDLNLHLSDM